MSPRSALPVFLAAAVLGCSRQDFSRSIIRNPVSELSDSGQPYVKPGAAAQRRSARLAHALAAWKKQLPPRTGEYVIGPNDALAIDILALEGPGKTTALTRTVPHSGRIALPWVGSIQAGGLGTAELEDRIKAAYAGRYLMDPQVTVAVKEYRSSAVVVTGAVAKPGVFCLSTSATTVLEVITLAGGLGGEAGDELLIVRGSSAPSADGKAQAVAVDLAELIDRGNLDLNLEVMGGDVLTVPPREPEYIYVLGYVQRPGVHQLRDGMHVDAVRAVALSGGLLSNARAHNSYLLRETPDGQQVIRVDLNRIARGIRPPGPLQAGDTLMVGSSFPARLAEYIKPTASVGASVAP